MRQVLAVFLLVTALAAGVSLLAKSVHAEAGDLGVRVRGIAVLPTADSNGIQPTLGTSSLRAGNAVVPELDFTYFFSDSIAAELILATSRHQIKGQGGIANLGNAASAWLLPPTLTLQYHFNPGGNFQPYVGAGLNYTMFYGEDADGSLINAVGATKVEADDSIGLAVQAGLDYRISENLFFNVDVKYVRISTDVTLRTANIGVQRTTLDINPVIVGVGIGYRFSLF
ncbi:MAG: OmpW family protein [Minwuia sp.]|nr:OmpW family protein [Minwuia sp.]